MVDKDSTFTDMEEERLSNQEMRRLMIEEKLKSKKEKKIWPPSSILITLKVKLKK